MNRITCPTTAALAALLLSAPASAQQFVDGLAQPVFAGQPIVSHNVWVEIPNLDSDRDGINDRIRIQVRRPNATDTGVKLPVVMIASPYSGGPLPFPQHDITQPLYVPPKQRAREGTAAGIAADRARAAEPRQHRTVPQHQHERLSELLPAARIHLRLRTIARHRSVDRLSDDRRL